MIRALVAAVVAALALAGCASGSSVAEAPAPVASAAPADDDAATTAPATMTVEQAGARWIELAGPANAAIAAVNQAYRSGASVATLRDLAADAVEGDSAILRGLTEGPAWPAEVEIELQQVAFSLSQQLTCFRAMARAGSRADVEEAWTELGRISTRPAQALRTKLGLGSVPVS